MWLGIEGRVKIKSLEIGLNEVSERLERAQRGFKELELEWTDVLDRLNRQVGRINARGRRAMQREEPQSEMEAMDDVSREIMLMRRGER